MRKLFGLFYWDHVFGLAYAVLVAGLIAVTLFDHKLWRIFQ